MAIVALLGGGVWAWRAHAGANGPATPAAAGEAAGADAPAGNATRTVTYGGAPARPLVATPFGMVSPALSVSVPKNLSDADLSVPAAQTSEPFDGSKLGAKAAILIDADTGAVLFAKNANDELPPASVTKLMTLDLVFDALEGGRIHPGTHMTVSERAWHTGGSSMFLDPSMRPTVEQLLYGLAVDSGNDAAVVLAEGLAGSYKKFVNEMNTRAAALGMTRTHFVTVNGLPDPNHYSTVTDLARLARHYLNEHPEALIFHSTKSFTFDDITQKNGNPLLLENYAGADGLKTGFASGCYNLVGTARRGNTRLLAVTLCDSTEKARATDVTALLNWGFAHYHTVVPIVAGAKLGAVSVRDGVGNLVAAMATQTVALTVPGPAVDTLSGHDGGAASSVGASGGAQGTTGVGNTSSEAVGGASTGTGADHSSEDVGGNGGADGVVGDAGADSGTTGVATHPAPLSLRVVLPDSVTAPLRAHAAVGKVEVMRAGQTLATVPLDLVKGMARAGGWTLLRRHHPWLVPTAAIALPAALLVALYGVARARRRRRLLKRFPTLRLGYGSGLGGGRGWYGGSGSSGGGRGDGR